MGKQCKLWQTLFSVQFSRSVMYDSLWPHESQHAMTILGGSKITADGDCSHEIKRCLLLGRKVITNLDSILKSRDITLPTKIHLVKATVFPVVVYGCETIKWDYKELDYKESWALKNWCFWILVLGKALESPLDCKEIQPVCPKGNQSWIFIGRTYAEAETPIFWPSDSKNWLTGKGLDARKDWRQEQKGRERMRWLDGITDEMDIVWVSARSWWWTGEPGMMQSLGLQRVSQATELNWTDKSIKKIQ